MIREFNNLQEIEKYYVEKTNTYVFKENDEYIDLVIFNFDLNIHSDIEAGDIIAWDINAWNIDCYNINAWDINVNDIDANNINANDINDRKIIYYAVCFAYNNIFCNSIIGLRKNARHFVLDGKLEVEEK